MASKYDLLGEEPKHILVKGYYITFYKNETEFRTMCIGKLYLVDSAKIAIEQWEKEFPDSIFLGMLYKEV